MTKKEIVKQIRKKKSFLCVGLDPDMNKIPHSLRSHPDALFEFCRRIVDATEEYTVAFKPNAAFFEVHGTAGWDAMERIISYIRKTYPSQFVIADAKRGDIGNTSFMYAQAFLERMDAHAVTVAPYMGKDSVTPFLKPGKWTVLLALTSNAGSEDFQIPELYKKVLQVSSEWGTQENMMYVAGATRAELLAEVRKIVPGHFLLVPGVGAQGGSLEEVVRFGKNEEVGLLVNASRSILYASSGEDFAAAASAEAKKLRDQMQVLLE
ncbi:MAG: orotidine-5'-phosphate decarboxylase [Bacteroidia bacterium]|nr:orotidine-5'-phosphate decarboxylase [Bacteroidia bacterium]